MRHLRVAPLGLLLMGLAAVPAFAQLRTIPLAADRSEMTLVEQGADVMVYHVAVGPLTAMDVMTKEGPFTRLTIPGFHTSKTEGAPEIPMMNRVVEIPYGAVPRIEVVSTTSRSLRLADYGITNRIFPAQPSMPKDADPATWPFVYDQNAYEVSRVSQDLVRVTRTGRLRAVDLGRLEVSPVTYFPGENRIEVIDTIEFKVHFDGADTAGEADLDERTYSPFFVPVYGMIEGTRGQHDLHPDHVRDVVTMVIVTPPQFEAQLQNFVDWKTKRGFHVVVGVTGTPQVGTTTATIQTYIRNLYNGATPELPAPSFVLFVGDVAQMPTWTVGGDATDRPYCDIDGDIIPDIYYGRLSATNATQLQAILDKTLMYDQFTMPDPSYLGEALMIGGMDGSFGAVWANGQINYGTNNYFNAAHGITSHTYLYPASGSAEPQILTDLSHGVCYANYTAHGSTTDWSDPNITQANVNALTNYGKYPLVVGNCCLTSSYDIAECFAETWLRASGKGAIGYIGGSNSTYWDEDYYWGVGYRSSIVVNPPYDAAHIGAYDGVFHDHGEPMTKWYVTNDALVFCGNLAVVESGSSLISYYWNIYNLMGDPSLSAYMGVPPVNPVTHPTTLFTTWTSFNLTAAPGSYVGLTKDGALIGAGTADENGNLTLPIWAQPLTPGTAHLVVMMQNRRPYQADLNVIVPAVVTIDPDAIDADVETSIHVGVFEYDGITPRPGVNVWADGLGYESAHGLTGPDGSCTLTVNYPYGPTLDIVGKNPADAWELFRIPVDVNAQALTSPNLWVTTDIGLNDSFALNLPGLLHAQVGQQGFQIYALLNGVPIGSTTSDVLPVTPTETGTVRGVIAVAGYDVYSEEFPVIEAFGTLSGHVDANGSPAVGAQVRGYDQGGGLVFSATTNGSGNYSVADEILCATYTMKVDFFSFEPWEEAYFVSYGANVLNISLEPAPSGVLAGTVLENETDEPLEATIKFYRGDTMALYAQTTTNPADGTYTSPPLPYFDYVVNVRAFHYIPVNDNVTISGPTAARNYLLTPTSGDLLVIDDASSKAAIDIMTDLQALGYNATLETMAATNPATWGGYDLILVTSGANMSTLENATFRTALKNWVIGGGHLLIEGGEVGYDWYSADASFSATVLHITGWGGTFGGNVTIAAPAHYVVSHPNAIAGPVTLAAGTSADRDALVPAADAAMVGAWSGYPTKSSIVAYDPNPAPEGGQIVFFSFNYSKMDAAVRPLLLQNAVTWLTAAEVANCSVSGHVTVAGETDHSGVRVEAIPGGAVTYTDAGGSYSLTGLFATTYQIRASKTGLAIDAETVTLVVGQQMTDCDFFLTTPATAETCDHPILAIPDNTPAGIADEMAIALNGAVVTSVEVYVNITHTYQGNLIVKVISPTGKTVILHNRTGGATDDIIGWYSSQLTPSQSLDAMVGEPTDGTWRLTVSDNASGETGTLNDWCLKITRGVNPAGASEAGLPKTLVLGESRPNPVTRTATIRFDLPNTGQVDLAVFDVSGRRVATLVSGVVQAGQREAIWNGRDDSGRDVASGLYWVRLTADGSALTRKMLVIR
jgi:subtilisin-like proprotein convertase family protein